MQSSNTVNPPKAHATHAVPPTQEKRSTRRSPFTIGLLLLAGMLVLIIALLFGYRATSAGRVFRGVQVLDKDLGGLSRAEAVAALTQASSGYPSGNLTISNASQSWTFSPADLGVVVDTGKTVDAAMALGRSGNFLSDLGSQLGTFLGSAQVTPALKPNTALIDKAVAQIAAAVDKPAIDSKLEQGPDGTVRITPSSHGTVIDTNAMRAAISSAVASVPFAPVKLTLADAPPKVTEAQLQGSMSQAMALTEQPLLLNSGKHTWTIQPSDLRNMLALSNTANNWTAALDQDKLTAYLKPVADTLRVEPTDASVTIGKGDVTLQPDKSGSDLDMQAAVAAIQAAATKQDAQARTVEMPIKEVPAQIRTAQLQALYDKANSLVTQGIRMRFGSDGYIMRGTAVTGFLDVAQAQGGPGPQKLVIDKDVLSNRISGIAYNINRRPSDARFRMVNGAPTKVAEAKEGYKVNVENSLQSALNSIDAYTGGDRLQVDLDVAVTQPGIKDADLTNINTPDLLSTGQTSYAGSSPERAWNVGLGTRNIDGALVPPGGVFSTVDTIGDLTLEAGFRMGYGIVGTGSSLTTVPSVAGGICQVSTTLFHSVFWAGLPMVERNWHSYWISLYGVAPSGLQGLDATISPPDLDFRFKNTTGNWLLIKATADGKNVTFQLYGVNPNWKVSVSGPVITNRVKTDPTMITEYNDQLPAGKTVLVEHAQDGFTATIKRVVTDASGKIVDDWTARSTYQPAHNRTLVGTGK
ncbi:MAG: peptidoglycan binding domain-containing protein [Chloroflexi bacterium]|nr:peptidoglycan binding domain-containing protein [Chloroflexota bacterium]